MAWLTKKCWLQTCALKNRIKEEQSSLYRYDHSLENLKRTQKPLPLLKFWNHAMIRKKLVTYLKIKEKVK